MDDARGLLRRQHAPPPVDAALPKEDVGLVRLLDEAGVAFLRLQARECAGLDGDVDAFGVRRQSEEPGKPGKFRVRIGMHVFVAHDQDGKGRREP